MTPQDEVQAPVQEVQTTAQDQIVVPLHAEEVSIGKRRVVTGQVKVSTVTKQSEQLVEELLARDHVEIERIAIGKEIDKAPVVREEGDVLVIPIVEEFVVVQRRLILKEEVRVRRVHETQQYQERVIVRKQEAVITRLPADTNPVAAIAATQAEHK